MLPQLLLDSPCFPMDQTQIDTLRQEPDTIYRPGT